MALQTTDELLIRRGGAYERILGSDIVALAGASLGTELAPVANITARDAIPAADLSIGDRVKVNDASADPLVTSGWAAYVWDGAAWEFRADQESFNVAVNATNLGYTASPTNGTITNSNGTAATLPLADGTNAGLLAPGDFAKLGFVSVTQAVDLDAIETKTDFITVTQAVNLDALEAASHAEASTAGTAATNPIVITGQEIAWDWSGLPLAS